MLIKSQKSQKVYHRMVEYETENIGFDWDIPKERYISQKKADNCWWSKIYKKI